MKMNYRKLIYILFIAILLVGCGESGRSGDEDAVDYKKPMSWGQSEIINTFADGQIWDYGKMMLKQSLEREFFTTNNENLFTVKKRKISDIKNYYKFANLLLFCNLDSDESVSRYVKKILPESALTIQDTSGYKIIPAEDFWAREQTVVFIIGKNTRKTLLPLYSPDKLNELFNIFEQQERKRLKRITYRPGVDEKEIKYQKQNYPWTIELPKGFVVFKRDDKNNFVSYLLRVADHPDRFLAVFWEPMEEDRVDKKWLREKRLEIGDEYYVGDEFSERDVNQKKINFNGRDGFKLWGRWQNYSNYTGGTFAAFAFYDEEQKMAYLIDNAVYFPPGDKLRSLIKLEIISKTFRTINQKPNEEEK
ncbi:MAG: DUF4837 family protein [Candidatus Cloacimonetes bacterium]|nr:DUF4837 family protein [Candidatus Cloacimonadota bacterium]